MDAPPRISVTSPIAPALERVRVVLFAPFDLERWLKLGFCAFLAGLLEGGGGGGSNAIRGSGEDWGGGNAGENVRRELDRAGEWLEENMATVVLVVTLVFLVIAAMGLLLLWLRSRGRFMFLDGVVRARGAVVEPWAEYRAEANSLLRFEVAFALVTLACSALAIGLGLGLAWSDIRAERFDTAAVVGLATFVGLILAISVTASVVALFVKDFVVPAMYAGRLTVLEGWRVVHAEVLAGRTGTIVLYVLMKILIALCVGIVVVAAGCATLCVGFCLMAIPYVGSVVLLPVLVFNRAFSVSFLQQLGGPWRLFPDADEPAGETPTDDAW